MKRLALVIVLVLALLGMDGIAASATSDTTRLRDRAAVADPIRFSDETPQPGSTVNAGVVRIAARITSSSPLTNILITLDGVQIFAASGPDGASPANVQTNWPVGPGQHTVVLSVTTRANQSAETRWTFSARDTGEPTFSNLSPAPGSTVAPGPTRVSVQINSLSRVVDVKFAVDGTILPNQPLPSESITRITEFVDANLAPGLHTAFVSATTVAGASNGIQWTFTSGVTPPPPTAGFTNLSPAQQSGVPPGSVQISATTNAPGPLSNVKFTVDGIPAAPTVVQAAPGTTLVLTRIGLGVGAHKVVITATDAAGASLAARWAFVVVGSTANVTCFAETGHCMAFGFKQYWNQHGGLAIFGFPITEEFQEQNLPPPFGDGRVHTVQYFQRQRFEFHPENPPPFQVVGGLLGTRVADAQGLLSTPPFQPVPPILNPACRHFVATGHNLCFGFRNFWQTRGGLPIFGFPISEEFLERNPPPPAGDGQVHTVQYFQRARFEYHPENPIPFQVELGLLGSSVVPPERTVLDP